MEEANTLMPKLVNLYYHSFLSVSIIGYSFHLKNSHSHPSTDSYEEKLKTSKSVLTIWPSVLKSLGIINSS